MRRIFQCWNNFERKELMEANIELLKKDTETTEMLCKIVNLDVMTHPIWEITLILCPFQME